jgi:triosephosphate isomerase
LIKDSVNASKEIPLIVGAGIKNSKDIKIGIKLGAQGFLVASGVVKASSIKDSIINLLEGF